MQFEDTDGAVAARNRKTIVKQFTWSAQAIVSQAIISQAIGNCAAQDLDARGLALDRDLAPRARKWRQSVNVTQHRASRLVPVDPSLGFVDFGGVGHALIALSCQL